MLLNNLSIIFKKQLSIILNKIIYIILILKIELLISILKITSKKSNINVLINLNKISLT